MEQLVFLEILERLQKTLFLTPQDMTLEQVSTILWTYQNNNIGNKQFFQRVYSKMPATIGDPGCFVRVHYVLSVSGIRIARERLAELKRIGESGSLENFEQHLVEYILL